MRGAEDEKGTMKEKHFSKVDSTDGSVNNEVRILDRVIIFPCKLGSLDCFPLYKNIKYKTPKLYSDDMASYTSHTHVIHTSYYVINNMQRLLDAVYEVSIEMICQCTLTTLMTRRLQLSV